jgi:hypothetical protein
MRENKSNMIKAATGLLTIKGASEWASNYIGKNVTTSNIAYLIQYGLIRKVGENGSTQVSQRTDTFQLCLTGGSRNDDECLTLLNVA